MAKNSTLFNMSLQTLLFGAEEVVYIGFIRAFLLCVVVLNID